MGGCVDGLLGAREFMQCFNAATEGQQQLDLVDAFFETAQPAQATAEGLAA